tara:strand:- start:421 stop:711 length:291 start_codon:yes stop_codon:yes gene_type:complete
MKRIKFFQDITLKYECKEKGSAITLYENNLDSPPLLIANIYLKDLIKENLNTHTFQGIENKYIENVIEDLDEVKKSLIAYMKNSEEYPEFGFGDNV